MDIRKVKKLIELLEESQLSEIEISEGEESIRLSRASTQVSMAAPMMHHAPPVTDAPPPQAAATPTVEESPGHKVTSPMVGTFYTSSSPDTPPFVSVGSAVEEGETLCIIEAMKIFNQIEADTSGVIKRILKNTGDPVEYGETLFIIG
ncbi:MAG: acetyl-CoA carboxylase biotin carboxyl carrier protein subunit [marine bacterium B5-7]|nr:MAG: acetyl-CoA carboxylase biotin carboxyl carrier protein subunit [marine bacterium B5-7]